MKEKLTGLERILGRKLKTLAMTAFTVEGDKYDLTLRASEPDTEQPHVHIVSYDSKFGKGNNRLGKSKDLAKINLRMDHNYTKDNLDIKEIRKKDGKTTEKLSSEERKSLISDAQIFVDMLLAKTDDDKKEYENQKNCDKFISVYITDHTKCAKNKEFKEYLDEVIYSNIDEAVNLFIDTLIKDVKSDTEIKKEDFEIISDNKKNRKIIKVSNLGIWNITKQGTFHKLTDYSNKEIDNIIDKIENKTKLNITKNIDYNYTLRFVISPEFNFKDK